VGKPKTWFFDNMCRGKYLKLTMKGGEVHGGSFRMCSSPNIIRVIKQRRNRWTVDVREEKCRQGFRGRTQKDGNHLEDEVGDGRIIRTRTLPRNGMRCIID
jgi:hypothetical protein